MDITLTLTLTDEQVFALQYNGRTKQQVESILQRFLNSQLDEEVRSCKRKLIEAKTANQLNDILNP